MNGFRLELPLPPSQNEKNRIAYGNRAQYVRLKNKWKRMTWQTAIARQHPWDEPAERTLVRATFHVKRKRDPDKLGASLEWILDALKQKGHTQEDKRTFRWTRSGVPLYPNAGYFIDDDETHLKLEIEQLPSSTEPMLVLWIEPL